MMGERWKERGWDERVGSGDGRRWYENMRNGGVCGFKTMRWFIKRYEII